MNPKILAGGETFDEIFIVELFGLLDGSCSAPCFHWVLWSFLQGACQASRAAIGMASCYYPELLLSRLGECIGAQEL